MLSGLGDQQPIRKLVGDELFAGVLNKTLIDVVKPSPLERFGAVQSPPGGEHVKCAGSRAAGGRLGCSDEG